MTAVGRTTSCWCWSLWLGYCLVVMHVPKFFFIVHQNFDALHYTGWWPKFWFKWPIMLEVSKIALIFFQPGLLPSPGGVPPFLLYQQSDTSTHGQWNGLRPHLTSGDLPVSPDRYLHPDLHRWGEWPWSWKYWAVFISLCKTESLFHISA